MFKNLSKLKSGKECDGFVTLVNGADFRQDDRCFYWLFDSEAFCISPAQEDMIGLLDDLFGVIQKFLVHLV